MILTSKVNLEPQSVFYKALTCKNPRVTFQNQKKNSSKTAISDLKFDLNMEIFIDIGNSLNAPKRMRIDSLFSHKSVNRRFTRHFEIVRRLKLLNVNLVCVYIYQPECKVSALWF